MVNLEIVGYLAIESFEGLFISGFEGTNIDAGSS